jgi:hypothetical protein
MTNRYTYGGPYDDRPEDRTLGERRRDVRNEYVEPAAEPVQTETTKHYAGVGPRGFRRTDDRIREEICDRLTAHGMIDASDVEVAVNDGVVRLTGAVADRATKRLAEDVVESVGGVRDVDNLLRVGPVEGRRIEEPLARSEPLPPTEYADPVPLVTVPQRHVDTQPVVAAEPVVVAEPVADAAVKDRLVSALFKTRVATERVVDELEKAGFRREDVSLLMTETTRGREFGLTTSSKAPEGATAGMAIGGVLGAIVAGLAAVGTIAVPGLGLVAAGPILAALAGAGAGGAAGGIIGALAGAGIPEREATLYSDALEAGGILVAVRTSADRTDEAERIVGGLGGESVSTRSVK